MKKQIALIFFLIIILTVVISGCQETKSVKSEEKKKVFLESSIVALKESELIFNKDGNKIVSAEAKYLFRNLLNEQVNLEIWVEFYDKNDNLLFTGGPKNINLLPLYTEQNFLGANSIEYSGDKAELVDHVVIIANRKN